MSVHVATAPDSWGVWFPSDPRQTHWARFLDEAVAAGYDAIELGPFGYLPTEANVLRDELAARGLTLTGGTLGGRFHVAEALDQLREETATVCDLIGHLGARYLVLLAPMYTDLFSGATTEARELDDDAWARMMDMLHAVGATAAEHGVTALFHPHAQAVVETEAQIERLLGAADPALLGLCLDVGHHAYAGGEPIGFLRRHAARIPYLHLKNVDLALARRVESEGIPFARAVELGVMTELDSGGIDFIALRDALEVIGFEGWGVVEQDMYPAPVEKPLPVAARNREFLRRIGIG